MAKVSLRVYNQEIEAMIDRGQLDEAVAHCRHILKTFPKHLETYRLLGKAYLEYKRYPDAADIFLRVLVATPDDFVANVGMSIVRDEENKLNEAIWHMERAYDTQAMNVAIKSELQRLYGRRDGVQPPNIRLTRGALANSYMRGSLYPQAIAVIKDVLKEDPGRMDMQVLLARAYFRSGLKNDAAEVASTILRTNPHCFDANRVLVEILGVDHPESVQPYRQRVVELDPYAAQVTSSVFQSDEVPNMAVTLERLDWNGQPVGMQPDWEASQAISLESGRRQEEQPDWLKNSFGETPAPSQPAPAADPFQSASPFDTPASSAQPAEPADEIPDFLRAAGWGESTGAFDESKPIFTDDEPAASAAQSIEQGDLPDWVKAMAPPQPVETPAEEEEMPDWINKIGTSALPAASESSDQADWVDPLSQPASQSQPADDQQPDWLKQFGEAEQSAAASDDQPDWLKSFAEESGTQAPASSVPAAPAGDLDWLSQLGQESEAAPMGTAGSDADFLKQLGSQPESAPADDLDWLNQLSQEPSAAETLTPAASQPQPASAAPESLGMSSAEQDDSFAWLEGLAAKQGATEGLLTKPEERLPEEPDWIKQVKDAESALPSTPQHPAQPPQAEKPVVTQPTAKVEELGKSEQEQDDSFAWLENLAAKQGATEGLLTKPEERLQEEPDWVKQAKEVEAQQPPQVEEPAVTQPMAKAEELGKSEQEQDDSFAWLENLAAKQGATEGLLTKPEERLQEEPDWVKQAKEVEAQQPPQLEEPAVTQPVAKAEELGKSGQEQDDSFAWLEGLAAKHGATEGLLTKPEERLQEEPDWVKQAKEVETQQTQAVTPVQPPQEAEKPAVTQPMAKAEELGKSGQEQDDSFAWLEGLAAKQGATEGLLTKPEERLQEEPDWVKQAKEVEAQQPPVTTPTPEPEAFTPVEDTAAWLRSLDEEEKAPAASQDFGVDETAMWLKNLDEPEQAAPQPQPVEAAPADDLPAWMQSLDEGQTPAAEAAAETEWMASVEGPEQAPVAPETPKVETGSLPNWLKSLDQDEETPVTASAAGDDLPAWLRDETGEVVAEPTKIEPTRASDWHSVEAKQAEPEPSVPEPVAPPVAPPVTPPVTPPPAKVAEKPKKQTAPIKPAKEPAPRRVPEPATSLDPVLGQARNELSRSNIPGALEGYGRLIKKGRFLEEVIYDLREALYRYPVEVSIWQSLGDAYMRANRLQDALDSYTKAEELLR